MGLIRLLLALSVVLAHSTAILGTELVGGSAAVECFFVISGFYMAMVLEKKYFTLDRGVWKTFMASRLARLYPVYLAVLLAAVTATVFSVWRGKESGLVQDYSELSLPGMAGRWSQPQHVRPGHPFVHFGPGRSARICRAPAGARLSRH